MPRKKTNPRLKRPKVDELNQISVFKNTAQRMYGLSIQIRSGAFIDTERLYTGPEIDAIRAWLKKQKRQLSLDEDWKPFLRKMGKSL